MTSLSWKRVLSSAKLIRSMWMAAKKLLKARLTNYVGPASRGVKEEHPVDGSHCLQSPQPPQNQVSKILKPKPPRSSRKNPPLQEAGSEEECLEPETENES